MVMDWKLLHLGCNLIDTNDVCFLAALLTIGVITVACVRKLREKEEKDD